jgi:hypothetical protein
MTSAMKEPQLSFGCLYFSEAIGHCHHNVVHAGGWLYEKLKQLPWGKGSPAHLNITFKRASFTKIHARCEKMESCPRFWTFGQWAVNPVTTRNRVFEAPSLNRLTEQNIPIFYEIFEFETTNKIYCISYLQLPLRCFGLYVPGLSPISCLRVFYKMTH